MSYATRRLRLGFSGWQLCSTAFPRGIFLSLLLFAFNCTCMSNLRVLRGMASALPATAAVATGQGKSTFACTWLAQLFGTSPEQLQLHRGWTLAHAACQKVALSEV